MDPWNGVLNVCTIIMQNPWNYMTVSKQKRGGRRERGDGGEGGGGGGGGGEGREGGRRRERRGESRYDIL